MRNSTITGVGGLRVGTAEDKAGTGCTVVIFDKPAPVYAKTFGGWPGTFDTESTGPDMTFVRKKAIFVAGGDILGLTCASGIMKYFVEREESSLKKPDMLPFIVGADIYDQDVADISGVDFEELGYRACVSSSYGPCPNGRYGAGVGATVGKLLGIENSSRGGMGSSLLRVGKAMVGTLAIVNALGNIYNPEDGKMVAGVRKKDGSFEDFEKIAENYLRSKTKQRSTTILVVVTNVKLPHESLGRVCTMAFSGLARCIFPVGMTHDGDTVFSASTERVSYSGSWERIVDLVGMLASKSAVLSVINAVKQDVKK